jgi:hypothetical protein
VSSAFIRGQLFCAFPQFFKIAKNSVRFFAQIAIYLWGDRSLPKLRSLKSMPITSLNHRPTNIGANISAVTQLLISRTLSRTSPYAVSAPRSPKTFFKILAATQL